jgi:hypothetical protein
MAKMLPWVQIPPKVFKELPNSNDVDFNLICTDFEFHSKENKGLGPNYVFKNVCPS